MMVTLFIWCVCENNKPSCPQLDDEVAVEEYEKWSSTINSTVSSVKVEQYEATKEDGEKIVFTRNSIVNAKFQQFFNRRTIEFE